ncbi:MAG: hypothetical protein KGM91_18335 [Burkholderiales bacterium]|nr:hypothetical protein [Burkholderiales bacterium]
MKASRWGRLALAGWLAWAVPLGWAAPAVPRVNLLVEWREVNAAAPGAPGDVVVGTAGGSAPPPGSVTVATGSFAEAPPQQLQVANGASAALRTTRLRALGTGEWVAGNGRAGAVGRTQQWIDAGSGFEVRPSWPGGAAPVTVEVSTRGAHGVYTRLLAPLGAWVDVARFAAGAGDPAIAPTLQLRVSRALR